ncbi:MAG: hypothetical protein EBR86_16445 [Planctomycetia bacterium]|nr:hypothetical protein [Planctomycetia bacterium]
MTMQFDRDTLHRALSVVGRAVPGERSRKPVLRNVLLQGGALTGTDLDRRISVDVAVPDHETLLLPHARLSAIVREVPRGTQVEIAAGTKCAKIRAGRGSWTISTEDPQEFPAAEAGEATAMTVLPAAELRTAIARTVFAADTESGRWSLTGVLLEVADKAVHFVATDGRMLASVECESGVGHGLAIVPAHTMTAIAAACEGEVDVVSLSRTPSNIVVAFDRVRITGRLLEAKFPKWRDAFPDSGVTCTAMPDPLLRAVRQAAIVTDDVSKGVRFTFGDSLRLASASSARGVAAVECELATTCDEVTVVLDPGFVTQVVSRLDPAQPVQIKAANESTAVVLRQGRTAAVIMPMDPKGVGL